jgi:hypothetical protein
MKLKSNTLQKINIMYTLDIPFRTLIMNLSLTRIREYINKLLNDLINLILKINQPRKKE